MKKEYDILIVGYGMLGNLAALLLADMGMSVVVVEKKQATDILVAKSARIDEEILLVLEQLGLIDVVKDLLYPLEGTQIVDKKERVLLEFNQTSRSQFAPLVGFYQPDIQKIIQEKAAAHKNINLFLGYEVETFEQDEAKVDVYISPTGTQNFIALEANFMLVCNGQYSRIADFLKIEIKDYKYHSSVLCVDTVGKKATQVSPNYAQTIYDAEFPVVKMAKGKLHQRWEFQMDKENIEADQTPEKVRRLLAALNPLDLTVESAFVYNFDSKILEKWQEKRVLILGDAAHIMPPYLGMGLSAGIKDVYNLAWKLRLIQKETASLDLLETYQQERQPDVERLIKLNLWIKRLFQSSKFNWIKRFVPIIPKWFLKKKLDLATNLKSGIVGHSKLSGRVVCSPKVANHKGDTVSFNQALEFNFVVLGLDKNPVDALNAASLEYLATVGTQFVQLTPQKKKFVQDGRYTQNLYDKEGKLQAWMKENKGQFLLIRPDRIVYDFCADKTSLNASVKTLGQQLKVSCLFSESFE
ncbi:MAG: Bifunctional 3-(3-hydroxy-phenyl)propionate/3-hydroxycinnamic acid hydroxylase [uncultured Aureispira sp.]|uniref:Bifunctional 3-(3-hydroxy-phenyl)propionate/3-hydroxycinnamic acid hydroxylase n=1 Tax=uncultured Aureispira sp. TaxID=1331704 RepID=A0A6S6U336_9BACT|nr:MAG: Bifunctional 3-(3-hydroxy-phenyl)propionate/3-hydroxycinnamic acid hydroxylase [uncultured Aureispira sp.]